MRRSGERPIWISVIVPLLCAMALLPAATVAQDFTVTSGQTVGSQTMNNVGDSGVIEVGGTVETVNLIGVGMLADDQVMENFGLITVTGTTGPGVYSSGANATINNSGIVETAGTAAVGILAAGVDAIINNSGHIGTLGDFAYGIVTSGDNATIDNSGSIWTEGLDAGGIGSDGDYAVIANSGSIETQSGDGIHFSGDNVVVTNSGSIATTEFSGIVTYSGVNATIVNSGSIETTGTFASGIESTASVLATIADATIVNSGRIQTDGDDSRGIRSTGDNVTVVNSGSISTSGIDAYGIQVGEDATITNAGSIIAAQADAILFTAGGATLNLLAGSVIEGGLHFSGTGNTVSFGPRLNAVMTFTGTGIPDAVETGGSPFAISGNTIAVLDPIGFALADDMAFAMIGGVARADVSGSGTCIQLGGGGSLDEGCAAKAWLTGFGGFGGKPGSEGSSGYDHDHGGVLAGLEVTPADGFSGGVFIGGAMAGGAAGQLEEATAHGAVAGGHVGFQSWNAFFADLYGALGILAIDGQRTIADNTVSGGLDFATATHGGYSLSPAVTLGADLNTGLGTLTPSLRLRYTGVMLDGYSESGAADGLIVEARSLHEFELTPQLALSLPVRTESGVISTTLRAGADLAHRQADEIKAELLGQEIDFASGGEGTLYRGFAAIELDYALAGGAGFFANVELGLDNTGAYNGAAQAGIRGAF